MPQACWQAGSDHRYWIEVAVGGQDLRVMLDLGLVDPHGRVGMEVEPLVYERLRQGGHLSRFRWRSRRDASGQISWSSTGLASVQLVDPVARRPIGPRVSIHISCGTAGVPNRIGVVFFFHQLRGCRVLWDLDQRVWCIDYP